MNWAPASGLPQQTLTGLFYLASPFPTARVNRRAAAREPLPDGLPDYLFYVTRNALLAATTSLTRVSTDVHQLFTQISQYLAFERLMSSMVAFWAPGLAPFFSAAAQPWSFPAQAPLLWFWGNPSAPALPKLQPPIIAARVQTPAPTTLPAPSYAAMMALPAAFFAFAPMVMDAWRVAA